jgi:hypothetical protein
MKDLIIYLIRIEDSFTKFEEYLMERVFSHPKPIQNVATVLFLIVFSVFWTPISFIGYVPVTSIRRVLQFLSFCSRQRSDDESNKNGN